MTYINIAGELRTLLGAANSVTERMRLAGARGDKAGYRKAACSWAGLVQKYIRVLRRATIRLGEPAGKRASRRRTKR